MIEVTGNFTVYAPIKQILGYECQNSFNVRAAVPLQPFGYNFVGGKLLALLAISDEVLTDWYEKYNQTIEYVLIMALNGGLNQYSGLKYFKAKGYSRKGRKRYFCDLPRQRWRWDPR